MLAIERPSGVLLIDCGGDVIHRCQAAGLDPDQITGILITHEHPDHVAGFALLISKLVMHHRKRSLLVYGIAPAIRQAKACLDCFDTTNWDLPEISWTELSESANLPMPNLELTLSTAPGKHGVQTIACRFDFDESDLSVTYSGDTEPSPLVARLAKETTVLIHEADGKGKGHSSIEEAATIARDARAAELILVHISRSTESADLTTATQTFTNITVAEDLMSIQLPSA